MESLQRILAVAPPPINAMPMKEIVTLMRTVLGILFVEMKIVQEKDAKKFMFACEMDEKLHFSYGQNVFPRKKLGQYSFCRGQK